MYCELLSNPYPEVTVGRDVIEKIQLNRNPHWTVLAAILDSQSDPKQYLTNLKQLSNTNKSRVELAKRFQDYKVEGYSLYHLTLTYKPYGKKYYSEEDINLFFRTFYLQHFLPYLLETNKYQRQWARRIQPICLAFLDEHQTVAKQLVVQSLAASGTQISYEFPLRLHHHAILAIHKDTLQKLLPLVGENTFAKGNFSHKVMTSALVSCDAKRLLYASKKMEKYPEFLSFTGLHEQLFQTNN